MDDAGRPLLAQSGCSTRRRFEHLKISEYVGKLDTLLEKERNSTIPFDELGKSYFPLGPCEWPEVRSAISNSKFVETLASAPAGRYVVALTNGEVEVGFSFLESTGRSELHYVRFKKF